MCLSLSDCVISSRKYTFLVKHVSDGERLLTAGLKPSCSSLQEIFALAMHIVIVNTMSWKTRSLPCMGH